MKLTGQELETVLRCVDKVFENRAAVEERDRSIAALEARLAALRATGNALARHVAEDTRGQTARQLVEAWEEAAR